jgi:hypothetical protein
MVGPESRCEIEESDELGLDIKNVSTRAKWRSFKTEDATGEVSAKIA